MNFEFDILREFARLPEWPFSPQSEVFMASAISAKMSAYAYWYVLVADKARWDFKHRFDDEFAGTGDQGNPPIFLSLEDRGCRQWFERSVPGNIHYGYVGLAAGFTRNEIQAGAGFAQVFDPSLEGILEELKPEWINTYFDNPLDAAAVEMGFELYELYGKNIPRTGFTTILRKYVNRMDKISTPSDAGQYRNVQWPYDINYFNGPGVELPGGITIK